MKKLPVVSQGAAFVGIGDTAKLFEESVVFTIGEDHTVFAKPIVAAGEIT